MAIYQLINCATRRKSVLTYTEEKLLHAAVWEVTGQEAAHVLPGILAGCDAAGITPAQLERVTVVQGPGSFTGLRVAVTVANMLAVTHPEIRLYAMTAGQLLAHLDGGQAGRIVFAPYASDVFLFDKEGTFLERQPGTQWHPHTGDAGELVSLLPGAESVRALDLMQLENATSLMALHEYLVPVEGQLLPFYAKDANITTSKRPAPGMPLA